MELRLPLSGGNYWSDYTGVDLKSGTSQNLTGSDGIGDTPYSIGGGAGAQDRYPLMKPWGSTPPPTISLTLTFPLPNKNAYNAKITSVFDHSMTDSYCSDTDNKVVAYTGETGTIRGSYVVSVRDCNKDGIKEPLYGFKKPDGSRFIINGNYAYIDTLYYDGHPGYDYPVPIGTDVLAAADGVVTFVDPQGKTAGGKYIIINHNDGYQTLYYHLNEIFVNTADKKNVNKGQVIAKSGNTGSASTGAHLHFEVRKNGIPVDPYGWEGVLGADPYTRTINVRLWETISPTPTPTPNITVTSPNGGENWHIGATQTISWNYTGNPGSNVKIELLKGGVLSRSISFSTPVGSSGSGSYNWQIPSTQILGSDYQVRITSTTNSNYKDTSDGHFVISTSWQKLTGPWTMDCDGSFAAIAIHPTNPDVIYIGSSHLTKGCGIYKSTDGGKTWSPKNSGLHQIGLFTKHYPAISKIVIAPSNPNILYIGTYTDDPILGPQGYIYRSNDGGDTWIDARGKSNWLGIHQIQNGVLDLAIYPANPGIVFAGLAIQGVYKTPDFGANWNQVKSTSAGATEDNYHIVRVGTSNTIFIAGGQQYNDLPCVPIPPKDTLSCSGTIPLGPFKSVDGGNNWINIQTPERAFLTDYSIDPSDQNILYYSTMATGILIGPIPINIRNKGIFKSMDGGNTWQAINNAQDVDLSSIPIYDLEIDPSSPNRLYVAAGFKGIFQSLDGGNSWVSLSVPQGVYFIGKIYANPGKLYALTTKGIFVYSL